MIAKYNSTWIGTCHGRTLFPGLIQNSIWKVAQTDRRAKTSGFGAAQYNGSHVAEKTSTLQANNPAEHCK